MKILIGDILQSNAQTLVNTVNCVGVMGKGIALEFKNRFPDMCEDYLARCHRHEVRPGVPYLYRTLIPPQIINFPTKEHWKSVSRVTDIERGLSDLLAHYKAWGVTSLAIPPLGCGNGQLEWRVVGPLIYTHANQMDIPIELYAPYGTHPSELSAGFLEHGGLRGRSRRVGEVSSSLQPAWLALVEIVHRIEQHPYHWPVGRTIFQKIAYVATQEGLPTGLVYERGSFGPFAKDLKPVETRLINNNLLQEERVGRMFVVKTGPNYARMRKHVESSINRWNTILDKVVDLFSRVNTHQAEIIATVLFAANELYMAKGEILSEAQVLASVMQWKQKRRPPLKADDGVSTIRNLAMLRLLRVRHDVSLKVPDEDLLSV
jgi:O-acetyl-ADP-ribose deacetylase (regulator of RNase III)/uncharacterized protein YwgA